MIVVTGASGNVGQHVVEALARQGHPVRALSRTPRQTADKGQVEWLQADFTDAASLRRALQGASRVVLISPAHRDMRVHQQAVVDAAAQAGVQRIAKLSGLGAGPQAPIRLAQAHYAIEQGIVDTGIAYSFVRPNLFMQVLLGSAQSIVSDGVIGAPTGNGAISFIDARDVADCLATEVLRDDQSNVVCEITGPQALTYAHVAEVLAQVAQRDVRHADVSPAQARAGMTESGMDPWLADAFVELFDIYRAGHGAAVLSMAVEATCGHPARSLAHFARDHASQFQHATHCAQ